MRFALPAVAAVALLTAGCGGSDDESAPATTAVTTTENRCIPATTNLMTPLANKLTLSDVRLSNGQVVESDEQDGVYFVGAELDSAELPSSGDVGVWATTSPNGAEAIFAVNDLAKQYTDWRDVESSSISADDEAADEARRCVNQ